MVGPITPRAPLAKQLGANGSTGLIRVDPAGHPEAVPYAELVPFLTDHGVVFPGGGGDGGGDGTGTGTGTCGVPYFIPATQTFTVPANIQGLFAMTIDVEGLLVVDGYLLEVDQCCDVPAHAETHEPGGSDEIEDVAWTDRSNTFTGDQTIDGDLVVTGTITPTRLVEQRPKIQAIEKSVGDTSGSRTLLSHSLVSGMSVRHEEALGQGRITAGNYDAQTYQPLIVQVESLRVETGDTPATLAEHLRVHASGGVTVGPPHVDPGPGVVHAAGLGATPLDPTQILGYPSDNTKFLRGDNTWAVPAGVVVLGHGFGTDATAVAANFSNMVATSSLDAYDTIELDVELVFTDPSLSVYLVLTNVSGYYYVAALTSMGGVLTQGFAQLRITLRRHPVDDTYVMVHTSGGAVGSANIYVSANGITSWVAGMTLVLQHTGVAAGVLQWKWSVRKLAG